MEAFILIGVLLGLIILIILINQFWKNPSSKDAAMQGLFNIDQNNLIEAQNHFDEALRKNPNNAWAYYGRARLALHKAKLDDALTEINTSLKLDPKNYHAYNMRSNIHRQMGNFEQALMDVDSWLKLKKEAAAYSTRAFTLAHLGRSAEALSEANYVIRDLHTESSFSYFTRGFVYFQMQHWDDAIYDFSKALAYVQDDAEEYEIYNLRADAYLQKSLFEEALEDVEAMIEIKPNNQSYSMRAFSYARMKNDEKANADYQHAYQLGNMASKDKWNFAVSYQRLLRFKEAAQILDEMLQEDTQNAKVYNQRAWIKANLGDYTGSLADAEKAIELDASIESYYDTRAQAKWLLGDYKGALADYNEAINHATKPNSIYFLGKVVSLYKLARHEEALALWTENSSKPVTNLQAEYYFAQPFYECLLEIEKLAQE